MVLKLFKCLATSEAPSFFPAIADSSDALQAAAVRRRKRKGRYRIGIPIPNDQKLRTEGETGKESEEVAQRN